MITKKTVFYGLGLVLLAGMLFLFNPAVSNAQVGIISGYVTNCGGCGGAISGGMARCLYHGKSGNIYQGAYMLLVPAGTHLIELSHPDFYSKSKIIPVNPGESKTWDTCLNKK